MIECKFTLDLSKNGIQKTVHAKAGEQNARKLIITLTHSGGVFDVQDCSAEVYFDTNAFSQAEIRNNAVEFTIPAGLAEGTITCELKIFKGDTQAIFSPMFEVVVEESIGNNGEAQALGEPIVYQKALSGAEVKPDDMQDEDYVIVFDYDNQMAMKLPWSKVKELLVVASHSVLEGRDAENQHPILAITGLQKIIDEFGETVEEMTESISKNTEAQHTHLYKGSVARAINEGELNNDVLDALSTPDGINLYFNGKKVGNDNVLTDEQKKRIDAAYLAMHKHTSAATGEDNLYVLEGFSEDADMRLAYFGESLAFLSDVNGGNVSDELVEQIEANTLARHTHENTEILDKLGESDGNLTYDGKAIGGNGTSIGVMTLINTDGNVAFVKEQGKTISSGQNTYNGEMIRGIALDVPELTIGIIIEKIEIKLTENGEYIPLDSINSNSGYPVSSTSSVVISTDYGDAFFSGYSFFGLSPEWNDIINNDMMWHSIKLYYRK